MSIAVSSRPSSAPPLLDHERLDAYRVAVALDARVVAAARRCPRGHAWLCDQAARAAASAVLDHRGALLPGARAEGRTLVVRLVSMLTRLIDTAAGAPVRPDRGTCA
jgi:hypothetical protein